MAHASTTRSVLLPPSRITRLREGTIDCRSEKVGDQNESPRLSTRPVYPRAMGSSKSPLVESPTSIKGTISEAHRFVSSGRLKFFVSLHRFSVL